MHIVFLVHAFPAIGNRPAGGAGSYVSNMARIMCRNGHKVSVITEAYENREIDLDGVTLYYVNATPMFSRAGKPMPTYKKFLKNLSRSYWYNRKVKQIHKKIPVDIVQSVNCYALGLLRWKKIPYLVRGSDDPYVWMDSSKPEFDFDESMNRYRTDQEMLYWAMKRSDAVIVPSFFLQGVIRKKTGIEAEVIESPILAEEHRDALFEETYCEQGKYWFTFGVMSYRKEIHTLASIIDSLLDEYPDMKYVMAGEDRPILYGGKKIMASEFFNKHIVRNTDRFVFLGEITDRDRLFSLIKNAKLCILPTRADNLPNSCLEAMAQKKIIISSTSDYKTSVEQLITDGKNGFLAQVGDGEELYKKIKQAMSLSSAEAIRMEEAAYERVKDLNPQKVYEKMMDIYEKLIDSYRNKG